MNQTWARLPIALLCCFVLSSCGTETSRHNLDETYKWNSSERAGLPRQGLLPQFLDSKTKQGETFYQYYFIQEPPQFNDSNYDEKTILFCAGGPGRNPVYEREKDNNFLADLPGYRVVYFHLRGSGFSQFPESNTYDRYLRSSYVVEDMELIRQKVLGDKRWAAVVGYSYGTILAQQYAHIYPDKLNKLILAAPMSRHQFSIRNAITSGSRAKQPDMLGQMRARDVQLRREMRETDLATLKEVIARDDFEAVKKLINNSSINLVDYIPRVVQTILEDVDTVAGSLPLLIESYSELQKAYDRLDLKGKQDLYKNLLEYSLTFFQALREIRYVGWVPNDDDITTEHQQMIGTIVLNEVLEHTKGISLTELLKTKLQLKEHTRPLCDLKLDLTKTEAQIKKLKALDGTTGRNGVILVPLTNEILPYRTTYNHICVLGPKTFGAVNNDGSKRVFAVMTFYDGLDPDILIDTLPNNERGTLNLISRICQRTPLLCGILIKIGRSLDETPKAWEPTEFKHDKPTLIIKGGADPVAAGGAAEHIYESGLLTNEKFLIEFPGIGHYLNLPPTHLRTILREQDSLWKGCDVVKDNKPPQIKNTRTCLVTLFLNDAFDTESRDQLIEAMSLELECRVKARNKSKAMSGIRKRVGNLPYRDIPTTGCIQKEN